MTDTGTSQFQFGFFKGFPPKSGILGWLHKLSKLSIISVICTTQYVKSHFQLLSVQSLYLHSTQWVKIRKLHYLPSNAKINVFVEKKYQIRFNLNLCSIFSFYDHCILCSSTLNIFDVIIFISQCYSFLWFL